MRSQKTTVCNDLFINDVRIVRLENSFLRVDVAPEIGGRIISVYNKALDIEFLWRNKQLVLNPAQPGDAYDPRFYGGIDEVIPGDIPEQIGALDCPDHGELWTLPLETQIAEDALSLRGVLPRWGLGYHKTITLRSSEPRIDMDYRIENRSGDPRIFLWKLHAALNIDAGDTLLCPANKAIVADPSWSRWKTESPFPWPFIHGARADLIPPEDGTTDFLFLYDLKAGTIGCQRHALNAEFTIYFDTQAFPYACYFASYGGLDQHYTAVLEPCTAMPVSVNEAAQLKQCSILNAGEELSTRVSFYAGPASLDARVA
jgi:galactose mutarotase-like enzyme